MDSRLSARALLAALIVVAHATLALLLGRGTLRTQTQSVPPLQVMLLDRHEPARAIPEITQPRLAPIQSVTIPSPEVFVPPFEEPSRAITAAAAAPLPPAPASEEPGEPPSLSNIAYLQPPAPHYPAESRRAREEGLVVLRVLIDASGHACHIEVSRSSGHPRLDAAAREAVERAVFKPYIEGGSPRAALAMIPIEFSLRGGSRSLT